VQFLFEDHVLDTDRRELRRGAQEIPVGPQVFDLLVYLVQNRERVVTKDDLLDAVWSGRFVSESNLTTRINAARKAIGDSGEEQRLIRTVPRKGFRFVGVVTCEAENVKDVRGSTATTPKPLPLPDKPSIAVLPFDNMSGDREQEYFADGIVEEIITAMSRFRQLFVIARNSTFTYKGRAVDVKQVGRELGVRYVLEGSVRKAANRVRITGQLVDASTGTHLWADRFDGAPADIFDLQDDVTRSVVGAIAPKMEQAEIERARRKPTESLDAYDYFLRGIANDHEATRETNREALRLFYRATELDPHFASAYGMAAWCYSRRKTSGWMTNREQEVAEAARLARRAVELGREDAVALGRGGAALAHVVGDLENGPAFVDRALVLNPNLAVTWLFSGWVHVYIGKLDTAIEHSARAMRLSPLDPLRGMMQAVTGYAHFFGGRYDEAASWAREAIRELPHSLAGLRLAAASNALADRLEEARTAMARLREADPSHCLSNIKDRVPLRRLEDYAKLEEGLRKAGLPE
jgi:TolB-like protein